MGWIIAGGVLLILVLWVILAYNALVRMRIMVEEAFSTMDVYMKKRYDLIPNLVETVKGYAAHEKETLENVIMMRNRAAGAGSVEERLQAENALTETLKSLFALAEAYPDLKANMNFMDLQGQLRTLEDEIANSRRYYNGTVRQYNTKREMFPSSVIAGVFHFEKKPLYEIASEERKNVKVQF
ncbi:MAG: LemA family protein [Bacillota bacterium]